mmetsp:Transcript_25468/g.85383  ORF Transcript_25468/g.85383 Transcript_25468/m.85383 type:complete len:227 (+) Transcript_25468:12-692(+)
MNHSISSCDSHSGTRSNGLRPCNTYGPRSRRASPSGPRHVGKAAARHPIVKYRYRVCAAPGGYATAPRQSAQCSCCPTPARAAVRQCVPCTLSARMASPQPGASPVAHGWCAAIWPAQHTPGAEMRSDGDRRALFGRRGACTWQRTPKRFHPAGASCSPTAREPTARELSTRAGRHDAAAAGATPQRVPHCASSRSLSCGLRDMDITRAPQKMRNRPYMAMAAKQS